MPTEPTPSIAHLIHADLDQVFKRRFKAFYKLGVSGDGQPYETEGAWNYQPLTQDRFLMLPPKSTLSGLGTGQTVLKASQTPCTKIKTDVNTEVPCTYVHLLTAGSRVDPSADIAVSSLELDAKILSYPVKALWILGAATLVEDVRVVGLWGSRSVTEGEAFGILLNNAPMNKVDGGVKIKSCQVEAVPGSYACAIYPGIESRAGKTLNASSVENCRVVCPSTPATRSHCGYGLNSLTTFENCVSHGFARGFFSDTGCGGQVSILNCTITGCHVGFELRSSLPEWDRRGLFVDNCTVVCDGSQAGWVAGVVLADDSPDSQTDKPIIDGVVVKNSTFYNTSSDVGHVGSSKGSRIAPVEFYGCKFNGKWDTAQAKAAGWKFYGCKFS